MYSVEKIHRACIDPFLFFFSNFFLSFTLHHLNSFTFTILFSFVNDHTQTRANTRSGIGIRVCLRIVKKKRFA